MGPLRRLILAFVCVMTFAATGCVTSRPAKVQRTIPDCLRENRLATFRIDNRLTESRPDLPGWLNLGPPDKAYGHGTGIVIHPDGYVLTNAHVAVENGWKADQSISVYLRGRKEPVRLTGRVVAVDTDMDLAVIKFDAKFDEYVILAEDDELEDGESVYNIGHPFDFGESVGRGYVMRQNYGNASIPDVSLQGTILLDIPDGSGTSGSGIFSERTGKVVGLMMAYTSRPHPTMLRPGEVPMVVRIAIPVRRIRRLLDRHAIPYFVGPVGHPAC